jgi:3-hydroxybutyryl-CoA dehydrogenase
MTPSLTHTPVLVVGAGIMGAGIAQVAAQAGHPVCLFDARDGAAAQATVQLHTTLNALAAKGKLTADAVAATLERITPVTALSQATALWPIGLVVEAIVEKLDAKRGLFRELEALVSPDCVLATNTSSISVTAIANGLQRPQRLVGMHFFNPVPLMKLVEVVSGLQTAPEVAQAIFDLSLAWGKTPVHARSTPGFIVNRIARPYYAETLALLQEQAASPAVLDACLRAAGFRMGPCELMDLIGHDTNFSVTQSVYEANFFDKRFVPSLVQRELVDGGLLGRKSGQGFFRYGEGALPPADALPAFQPTPWPDTSAVTQVVLAGAGPVADWLATRLDAALATVGGPGQTAPAVRRDPSVDGVGLDLIGPHGSLRLCLTDGRPASLHPHANTVVFDLPLWAAAPGAALACAASRRAAPWALTLAQTVLRALGCNPLLLSTAAEVAALPVARTVAMLINEAADAVHQGVCTEAGADTAMKLGVNYPAGPFEWLAAWDARAVVHLLDALDTHHRGERYRVSPGLRARAVG